MVAVMSIREKVSTLLKSFTFHVTNVFYILDSYFVEF